MPAHPPNSTGLGGYCDLFQTDADLAITDVRSENHYGQRLVRYMGCYSSDLVVNCTIYANVLSLIDGGAKQSWQVVKDVASQQKGTGDYGLSTPREGIEAVEETVRKK